MSWSPDLFIGELRPWPESVHVVRGKTDEARRYTPERKDGQEALERRIDELCQENERLRADQAHWELGNCPSCPNVVSLQEALEQSAKLRELAVLNWECAHSCCGNNCKMKTNDCGYQIDRECNYEREIWDRMRELGIEVPS